ncbi:Flp pilus assembly protein CpaB [Isoptericola halotolerans]|uniref:Flp pilus assembly protein CpaB n=1 Tax=Isoptericola halotolerans TaxID=300560 RepID=UPI00388F7443
MITSVLAVAVFTGVMLYVGSISTQVGPTTTTLRLTRSVEAMERIDASMVAEVEVPERWIPETAVRELDEVEGLVAATAYEGGSVLQSGMLITRPGVQPGFREVAIIVDAETGVAGKVEPGDHVDIIATTGGDGDSEPVSRVWVSNALVLDVGLPRSVEDPVDLSTSSGLPVTFALSTEDALTVAYVESFSVKMRLALRGTGDDEELPPDETVFDGTTAEEQD